VLIDASTRYLHARLVVKRALHIEKRGSDITHTDDTAHCKMAHYRRTIDLPNITSTVDAP
jgi:hypothetical protein